MGYEQKPNTGSLFKNDKKETDSHPAYKGSALVDGQEYWLSAWINETKDGNRYMKLAFKAKEEQMSREQEAEEYHDSVDRDQDTPF